MIWLLGCTWIDEDALKERLAMEAGGDTSVDSGGDTGETADTGETGDSGETGEETADPAEPDIEVSTGELDLGVVYVGVTASGDVRVDNVGDAELAVEIAVIGSGWSVEGDTLRLSPRDNATLTLGFSAAEVGTYAGTLTLTSDDPDEPVVVVPLTARVEIDPDLDDDGSPTVEDCDDTDASVFPGAPETWYDGVDQDCDGWSDYDQDRDGDDATPWGSDCDDLDATVSGVAPELGYTGRDEDCDGVVDEMAASDSTWTVVGTSANDAAGSGGVFALPDLDGDGNDELVVCTPGAEGGTTTDRGAVSFHDVGDRGSNVAFDAGWLTLTGNSADDWLGADLAVLGDYDGDGFPELAVGAWQNDAYGTDDGTVYVVRVAGRSGSEYGAIAAVSALYGNASSGWLGYAVAGGDFDGDGLVELATGAPGESSGRGDVHVTFVSDGLGSASFPAEASTFSITGVSSSDHLGYGLDFGDLDDDGYEDLVACSPDDDDAGSGSGTCWIVGGSATRGGLGTSGVVVSSIDNAVIVGSAASDRVGATSRAMAVGDFDDDGRDDLALGAPNPAGGAIWIFGSGRFAGTMSSADADWIVTGTGALGTSVALGDVTGDGVADLLGGAPNAGPAAEGVVYLLAGGVAPGAYRFPADQAASWTGEAADDDFGTAVSAGADLDGDGAPDLVVSSALHDGAASATGKAYVLSGY